MLLTKEQRTALKKVYDRQPIPKYELNKGIKCFIGYMTYREFRRTVHLGCDCIMVPWCNMWLGIEPDGYTHS